ncbi:MAG: TM0996/MTH895 family glutaredoxin-like protein [Thermoguttaceae bacterium]|nr:TM0996/MTH895 family glutaredoxin-like protein [Thermoguttaceae bacterium]MBR4102472.1 TM0996/MTH895 family glutaredoxin-like protein [Thermoguttaceae bacterium]
MLIQVLGTGCVKCQKTAEAVAQAARELGVDVEIEKVTSLEHIIAAGVMATPALIVDGRLRVAGRAPSLDEAKKILAAD